MEYMTGLANFNILSRNTSYSVTVHYGLQLKSPLTDAKVVPRLCCVMRDL